MPRGVKRSEIEIIQAEIAATEKKRDQSLQAAADAKKAITKLQDKIEQQYSKEIAKACRTAGIPLEEVLNWVKDRQLENISNEKPATPKAVAPKTAAPKAAAKKRPAPKKTANAATRTKSAKKAPANEKSTTATSSTTPDGDASGSEG